MSIVSPIPTRIPVLASDGSMSRAWINYFQELTTRVGGSYSVTLTQVSTDLTGFATQITGIQGDITTLQLQESALSTRVTTAESRIKDLQVQVAMVDAPKPSNSAALDLYLLLS